MPKLHRPHLEDVIETLARAGRLRRVFIVKTGSTYQASTEREPGKFTVHVDDDVLKAVYTALGPYYGHSWEDHLGQVFEPAGPMAPGETDEDEDDDLARVI